MNKKTPPASHHLLTSPAPYSVVGLRMTGGLCGSMRRQRFCIFSLVLAAVFVTLSPGLALAKPKPRQSGLYDVTISGYYHGAGMATATVTTVSITAEVKDDTGAAHRLSARSLARDPDRHYLFSGRGSLDGMEVSIDGRVDAPDPLKTEVLKAGRIVFTFKVIPNGKHGRGGGEKRTAATGNGNGGNGNGGNGNGNGGGGNGGGGDSGNGNSGHGNSGNGGRGNGNH